MEEERLAWIRHFVLANPIISDSVVTVETFWALMDELEEGMYIFENKNEESLYGERAAVTDAWRCGRMHVARFPITVANTLDNSLNEAQERLFPNAVHTTGHFALCPAFVVTAPDDPTRPLLIWAGPSVRRLGVATALLSLSGVRLLPLTQHRRAGSEGFWEHLGKR
jgi:hypothetical protein